MELTDAIEFDPRTGLVPAVVQSVDDGRVRMLAWMDREAVERTLQTGRVTFWSRSREELWVKGETSGNWLEAVELRADCDGDALLVRARPHGPTCHTGEEACFDAGRTWTAVDAADGPAPGGDPDGDRSGARPAEATRVAEPGGPAASRPGGRPGASAAGRAERDGADAGPDLSGAGPSPAPVLASVLEELVRVVADRDRERPGGSYTADLLERGASEAARKVGEEAVEAALAAVDEPGRLADESADLLYHLVVLWRAVGLPADAVGRALSERRGP